MRTLDIVHIRTTAGFYGAESVILTLISELQRAGVVVTLVVFSRKSKSELGRRAKALGVSTLEFDVSHGISRNLKELRKCFMDRRFVLAHTHDYRSTFLARACKGNVWKLVGTVHGWTGRNLRLRAYSMVERACFRKFDAVICVDSAAVPALSRKLSTDSKVVFIANGVDVDKFPYSPIDVETRRGAPLRFACVGRLQREKGQSYLLNAIKLSGLSSAEAQFVFIGDGEDRPRLQELCSELGLNGQASFVGNVEKMLNAYIEMDCLVLPSVREGMPMAILEAMAVGRVVVATRVGAIPEVVSPDEGVIVDPENVPDLARALRWVVQNRGRLKEMGLAGKNRVHEHFGSRTQALEYRELYGRVAGGKA